MTESQPQAPSPSLSVIHNQSMPASSPALRPCWVVLDTRTATAGVASGVSRFVVGLAGGLAQFLSSRGAVGAEAQTRVLLVGKQEPAPWIIALVRSYPGLVTYWSGGPGSLTRKSEKPVWLWSSRVLREIARYTHENFFWVAPGNFDRPLLWPFGKSRWKSRLVQVVHDTIPVTQKSSMGFFFRLQFGTLVRRSLNAFPHVVTVSRHSAEALAALVTRRSRPVGVVGNGIEDVFGAFSRVTGQERTQARLRLLTLLFPQAAAAQKDSFRALAQSRWVVGVGRYQKYKSWELAEEATPLLNGAFSEGAWFFRVGLCAKDIGRLARAEQQDLGGGTLFPSMHMVGISTLSDELLSILYTLSDVCVQPSRAEGFGLPPLESAFCGTPVVYRKGTAVDDHFADSTLPEGFALALDAPDAQTWARALAWVIEQSHNASTKLGAFVSDLSRLDGSRARVASHLAGGSYAWKDCAARLLKELEGGEGLDLRGDGVPKGKAKAQEAGA